MIWFVFVCLRLLSVQVLWDVMLWHWPSGSQCSVSVLWLHLRCQAVRIGWLCISLTQEPLIQWHTQHTLMAVVCCLFTAANRWTLPYDGILLQTRTYCIRWSCFFFRLLAILTEALHSILLLATKMVWRISVGHDHCCVLYIVTSWSCAEWLIHLDRVVE